VRGVVTAGAGEFIVTTSGGQVSRWWPTQQKHEVLAEGFDRPYGVALTASGAVVFADAGTGRVLSIQSSGVEILASDLQEPKGVAIAADGTCLVAEEAAGRIVKIGRGGVDTVLDGLQQPQGILVRGDSLYIVDAGSKEVIEYNLANKSVRTIASGLPLGAPAGVTPKFLKPFPPLSGSMGPFAGIAAGADGTLYVSADGDGSVLALRPR
jgi:glucose/arabinose dehydrogenase